MLTRRFSTHFLAGLIIPFLLFVILVSGGCGEDSPVAEGPGNGGEDPPPPTETIPDSAVVSIQLVAWNDLTGQGTPNTPPGDVDEVRFEISAPDITTQTRTVTVGPGILEEDFIIETGVARRIDVLAFNAASSLLYGGTKYTDIADSALVTGVGMVFATDVTAPVFPGIDSTFLVSDNHVLISWPVATDGSDPDLEATYLIYMSTVSGSFDYASPSYAAAPGQTSYLVGDLDPGTSYYFVVRAVDRAGNISLNTAQKAITTPGAGDALYVDVQTGADNAGCGTSSSPCKTISHALSKSAGNQTIRVAKGTYNAASGETFPLQLKPGTTIDGEGYWWMGVKVIKETYIEGPAPVILGADNATIVSCYVRPTGWGSSLKAIDDDGAPITIYHCTVDGSLMPGGWGVNFSGASSLIGCRVENFSGGGGRAVSVWGTGGAVVDDNLILNNLQGIYVTASNCEVNNCVVQDITSVGISVGFRDVVTDDILIFRNLLQDIGGDAIHLIHCTDTEILSNSISGVGGYGISIWNYEKPAHHVKALANSVIHGASVAVYVLDGQATINDNMFVCNAAGAFVRSDQVIDLRWNEWENDPPTISSGRGATDPGCDGFYDICYEALYALTPPPVYQPHSGKGSCLVGIVAFPSAPRAPAPR